MVAVDNMKTETTATPKPERGTQGNESYLALVWRRLRRSFTGMLGLVLVVLLILIAIFADFFAPMNPLETNASFSPPQVVRFSDKDGNISPFPRVYATAETEELDPVTFQPICLLYTSPSPRDS